MIHGQRAHNDTLCTMSKILIHSFHCFANILVECWLKHMLAIVLPSAMTTSAKSVETHDFYIAINDRPKDFTPLCDFSGRPSYTIVQEEGDEERRCTIVVIRRTEYSKILSMIIFDDQL